MLYPLHLSFLFTITTLLLLLLAHPAHTQTSLYPAAASKLISAYIPAPAFSTLTASILPAASSAGLTFPPSAITSIIYSALQEPTVPAWFAAAVPSAYRDQIARLEQNLLVVRSSLGVEAAVTPATTAVISEPVSVSSARTSTSTIRSSSTSSASSLSALTSTSSQPGTSSTSTTSSPTTSPSSTTSTTTSSTASNQNQNQSQEATPNPPKSPSTNTLAIGLGVGLGFLALLSLAAGVTLWMRMNKCLKTLEGGNTTANSNATAGSGSAIHELEGNKRVGAGATAAELEGKERRHELEGNKRAEMG